MTNQNTVSFLENLEGLGLGACLCLGGLVITIGDISLGALMGVPMILVGVMIPLLMTRQAQAESERQAARRRPERDHSAGYNISSKSLRRGR